MRMVLEDVQKCKKNVKKFESNEHFDSVVALMAVSLKDCKVNVIKAIDKDLIPVVAEIANGITWECGAYINILRVMEYISYKSDEAASHFIQAYVHKNIL